MSARTPAAVTSTPAPGPFTTSGRSRYRFVVKETMLSLPESDENGCAASTVWSDSDMATAREIRTRIRTVKNIQKITQAMKLVAAARFNRAQMRVTAARPYAEMMQQVMQRLAGAVGEVEHPLLEVREERNIAVVVITSDRGLCGSYNTNMLRKAMELLRPREPETVRLYTGLVPLGGELFHRIVVREGFVPHVEASDFSFKSWTDRRYFEVCTSPEINEYIGNAAAGISARK